MLPLKSIMYDTCSIMFVRLSQRKTGSGVLPSSQTSQVLLVRHSLQFTGHDSVWNKRGRAGHAHTRERGAGHTHAV